MDLMHVHSPLTGSAWATGVFVIALILAGLPVALAGLVTSAVTRRYGYRWPPAWRMVFQGGFVIQICSLVLTVPMFLLSLVDAGRAIDPWQVVPTLILAGSVVGGGFALGRWRELMAVALPQSPPSILR